MEDNPDALICVALQAARFADRDYENIEKCVAELLNFEHSPSRAQGQKLASGAGSANRNKFAKLHVNRA
jgi:hypothetical protein